MNRLPPNNGDDDDEDMDTEDEGSQPIPPPLPPQPINLIDTESEFGDDDDDEDYELLSPPPPPLMPNDAATSYNGWTTLIPASFIHGATASNTRIRGGNVTKTLRVFSVAMLPHPRPELENGGKMILPPSFLSALTQRVTQLTGPMLFRVSNNSSKKVTHCGVLEFIAEEGRCYMPYWRMHNIGANEGDVVNVENITAQIGKFALFEPQSVDFLDISNPTALLENALRNFACITKGETIVIHYNDRMYELKVLDTKPSDVLNIIECDMDVDFAPAVGLPKEKSKDDDDIIETEEFLGAGSSAGGGQINGFTPFVGVGSRLNGKPVEATPSSLVRQLPRGQPDFEWRAGNLRFIRKQRRVATPTTAANKDGQGPSTSLKDNTKESPAFIPFKGHGVTLNKGNHHEQ